MAATTELEAVNLMLSSIGERPVQDLTDTGRLDLVRARAVLDEVSKSVQSRGWWFNHLQDQKTLPGGGEYVLAANTLRVLRIRRATGLGSGPQSLEKKYVARHDTADSKLKLFDKTNRTFGGNTQELVLDLIEELEFEELPETARKYIALRASVTFQARTIGSPSLNDFIIGEAEEAWKELKRADTEYEAEQGTLNDAPLMRDLVLLR